MPSRSQIGPLDQGETAPACGAEGAVSRRLDEAGQAARRQDRVAEPTRRAWRRCRAAPATLIGARRDEVGGEAEEGAVLDERPGGGDVGREEAVRSIGRDLGADEGMRLLQRVAGAMRAVEVDALRRRRAARSRRWSAAFAAMSPSRRAAKVAIDTWSSWLAEVGSESTRGGMRERLVLGGERRRRDVRDHEAGIEPAFARPGRPAGRSSPDR